MPLPVDRPPLRSATAIVRGGLGFGLSIACVWYLMRAGLLRAHLPQVLALPETAGEWVMPIAIMTMLACSRCVALMPRATHLSRVHDAALAALLLPLLGLVPGLGPLAPGIGILCGALAVAGATLLFHGWGVRLAALSSLDAALCFAVATFVAESVLALSISGLGGEAAWLAVGVGLPLGARLLLGKVSLPEVPDGREPAPLRPLPPSLLAALFLASAACGLFYQLLDQLPPESDATVMASSAVFCGVALCAAILLRFQPTVAPRHLFRLALPLLGLGFATLMLLGQRLPRVPMFIQLSGSALLDVFMYTSLLHSAGLHANRNRARMVALYWAMIFGAQWTGSLLSMGLGWLLPPDIAHIQIISLAAVCAIISIMLVVRPDPATYMGWRLPGHVPDDDASDIACPVDDADCDDNAMLRTILSDMATETEETTATDACAASRRRATDSAVADAAITDAPPQAWPPAPTCVPGTPVSVESARSAPAAPEHPAMPRHPAPVGADGAELPLPTPFTLPGMGATISPPAHASASGPADAAQPAPPARPAPSASAAPRPYPSAPPAECLADSLRRMGLTRQQVAVTLLLADRHSGPEICDRLNISYNTLKTHVRNIYRQLGVANQQELRNAVTRFDPARPSA
ncbi:helix-turn-helix transcriptional regulator [Nitratidesulfovibrio sp. HK-II]|uniref:helix-turn-helix transcriptional regulator n=1 Tax=Nitratidesulfovibrio sp. HK-II TaxID=2009266 RepID=UPI000EDD799A|nr:helix-turn-helix transcriptional regulator [Nitratidesulfovibrio sp. HK-II]GBO95341.1 vegetative cell wall protein gp1 precursor [Nitratidesulfovibrio sp. HK-II]